jgi:hypothetical protein
VGREPGTLGQKRQVGVDDPPAGVGGLAGNLSKQDTAVDILPTRVGIGKMDADVAKTEGAKDGVAQRMDGGVGVGVAEKAFLMGDVDAAENQTASGLESVYIHPLPHTQGRRARGERGAI